MRGRRGRGGEGGEEREGREEGRGEGRGWMWGDDVARATLFFHLWMD